MLQTHLCSQKLVAISYTLLAASVAARERVVMEMGGVLAISEEIIILLDVLLE